MTSWRLPAAAVLLLLLPAAACAGSDAKKKSGPLLLLHDWFGTSPAASPAYVRDHLAFLESQPFDGIVLYLRTPDLAINVTAKVMSASRVTAEQIEQVLQPLAAVQFRSLLHNFAAVLSSSPPDVFDDWGDVVRNFTHLARAAKDFRLKGVYIDNENYGTRWADYPAGVAYPRRTLPEYQEQARLRGKQVLQAMSAVYPEITVVMLHGPYISEPKAPHPLFPSWEGSNRLLGPFFAGAVDGAGPAATCVDGGELYHLRSAEDFQKSYEWRRSTLASDRVNCSYLPPSARSRWDRTVSIAFGLYDRPFGGFPMDAATLRACVARAMARSDRYVWLYVEGPTFLSPPGQEGAPADWVSAVRLGRADGLGAARR